MNKNELNVLWTNADPITSEHMVLLYSINAKKQGWFDQVNLIIWGATASLAVDNAIIKELVLKAIKEGLNVVGCLHCAQQLGKEAALTNMGVKLSYMGNPLSEIIKNKENLLTV